MWFFSWHYKEFLFNCLLLIFKSTLSLNHSIVHNIRSWGACINNDQKDQWQQIIIFWYFYYHNTSVLYVLQSPPNILCVRVGRSIFFFHILPSTPTSFTKNHLFCRLSFSTNRHFVYIIHFFIRHTHKHIEAPNLNMNWIIYFWWYQHKSRIHTARIKKPNHEKIHLTCISQQ